MSAFNHSLDVSNTPSGKSSQTFYFAKHYEAKHAIGKQHSKRMEFQSREGIACIQSCCDFHISSRENPAHYGRFIISGRPDSVDKVMVEIKEWLDRCQTMHLKDTILKIN